MDLFFSLTLRLLPSSPFHVCSALTLKSPHLGLVEICPSTSSTKKPASPCQQREGLCWDFRAWVAGRPQITQDWNSIHIAVLTPGHWSFWLLVTLTHTWPWLLPFFYHLENPGSKCWGKVRLAQPNFSWAGQTLAGLWTACPSQLPTVVQSAKDHRWRAEKKAWSSFRYTSLLLWARQQPCQ